MERTYQTGELIWMGLAQGALEGLIITAVALAVLLVGAALGLFILGKKYFAEKDKADDAFAEEIAALCRESIGPKALEMAVAA